jgi:hypothetical protein
MVEDNLSVATVTADSLNYETLPNFDVYMAACWAVQDSIKRVEPAAGVRVNPEQYA